MSHSFPDAAAEYSDATPTFDPRRVRPQTVQNAESSLPASSQPQEENETPQAPADPTTSVVQTETSTAVDDGSAPQPSSQASPIPSTEAQPVISSSTANSDVTSSNTVSSSVSPPHEPQPQLATQPPNEQSVQSEAMEVDPQSEKPETEAKEVVEGESDATQAIAPEENME